jgi:hypothetical protein
MRVEEAIEPEPQLLNPSNEGSSQNPLHGGRSGGVAPSGGTHVEIDDPLHGTAPVHRAPSRPQRGVQVSDEDVRRSACADLL